MPYLNLQCPTCSGSSYKWGVYAIREGEKDKSPLENPIGVCEHCGSHTDGDEWKSSCTSCSTIVENGKLTGLFVPHLCGKCEKENAEKDIKAGHICSRCRAPYSRCCC